MQTIAIEIPQKLRTNQRIQKSAKLWDHFRIILWKKVTKKGKKKKKPKPGPTKKTITKE